MLRAFFLVLSKARWAQRLITRWKWAWRVASRFVAGETAEDALRVTRELNQAGMQVSLDHLGEHTENLEDARQSTADIQDMLRKIAHSGARASLSIKLSQIGLNLSEELCRANLVEILKTARECSTFVRIDMEESDLVQRTLDIYRWARQQGFDQLGVVIQSYLYRSEADLQMLTEMDARVRLVKGAYKEPAAVAYPDKKDVDANYDRLAVLLLTHCQQNGAPLLSEDGRVPPIPAFGTHDLKRIQFAQDLSRQLGLPTAAVEYQMLYGIRRDLQLKLASAGYPVRVYVPYGSSWYPYLMRRLGERPANLWFVLSNLFQR